MVGEAADLLARGGTGGSGTTRVGGNPGGSGGAGASGAAGDGGDGGAGGTGGDGGQSGPGAGGAGGTVKLFGSVVEAEDAVVDTSGGAGAGDPPVRIADPGLSARFYNVGALSNLPNFNTLTPVETRFGVDAVFEGNGAGRFSNATASADNFAARWTGNIVVEQDATINFFLGSDDGSQLWIDGNLIVDNNGLHGFQYLDAASQGRQTFFQAGTYDIDVRFFERGGFAGIALEYGAEGVRRPLTVAPPGDDGRFIIGKNAGTGPTVVTAASVFDNPIGGFRSGNPFVEGDPETPLIAGLQGGAEAYGLLDVFSDRAALNAFLASVDAELLAGETLAGAPDDALAAVVRLDGGPAGFADDYAGFDMMLVVNLSDIALAAPELGIAPGDPSSEDDSPLLTGGFATDPVFGGTGGPQTLAALPAYGVWATLIPDTNETDPGLTMDYVTASVDGQVQGISGENLRDGESAFLRAPRPADAGTTTLPGVQDVTASPDGEHVYAVNTGQNVLIVVNGDGLDQRQQFRDGIAGVDGLDGARTAIVSGDGRHVYVAGGDDGKIALFARDQATGDLTFVDVTAQVAGQSAFSAIDVSDDGSRVVAAGADGLITFARDPGTGALTPLSSLVTPGGIGDFTDVAFSADRSTIYAVSPSTDTVVVADANDPASALQVLTGAANGLDGARALSVSSDDRFVYVIGETEGTLAVFARDPATGLLSRLQVLREGESGIRGLAGASDVLVSADGAFVHVAGGAGRALAVFARAPDTGLVQFAQVLRGRPGLESPVALAGGNNDAVYVASETGFGLTAGGLAAFTRLPDGDGPTGVAVQFTNLDALTLRTGDADDSARQIDAALVEMLTIDLGDGFNTVDLLNVAGTTTVTTGIGNDAVSLRSATANGVSISVDTGGGSDAVVVRQLAAGNGLDLHLGGGDDEVQVAGDELPAGSAILLAGDAGIDTLNFDSAGQPVTPPQPAIPDGSIGIGDPAFAPVAYSGFEAVPGFAAAVVGAGGPYTIAEGAGLSLSGSASPATNTTIAAVDWDLNGDGTFGDAVGLAPVLTWPGLVALGLGDDGSYDITLRITDDRGVATTDTVLLTITDTPPVVEVSGRATVPVGEAFALMFSAADPGDDPITRWTVDWGDGGAAQTFASDAMDATHVYETTGVFDIAVQAVDETEAGPGGSATLSGITVTAAVPTLATVGTATDLEIAEGEGVTFRAAAPGLATFTWDVNGDGVFGDEAAVGVATGGDLALRAADLAALGRDDGDAAYPVAVRAVYGAGPDGVAETSALLTLRNAPPTAALTNSTVGGGSPVPEGTSATVRIVAPSDPSAADRRAGFSYSFDFDNDGVFEIADTSEAEVAVPGAFLADAGIQAVRAVITDKDGGQRELITGVRVAEVAPTLELTGADGSAEGAVYTLGLAATDPGDDVISRWIVNWGDGTTDTVDAPAANLEHVFADDGTATIVATAIDGDGLYTASRTVNVANVDPVLSVSGPATVNEAEAFTLTLAAADPGDDSLSTWSIDWGDGSRDTVAGRATSASHVYADDSAAESGGQYSVTVTATDEDGTVSTTTAVTVVNVAPTASLGSFGGIAAQAEGPARISEGRSLTLVVGVPVDPGADTVTGYLVDWGDASPVQVVPAPLPDPGDPLPPLTVDHVYTDGDAAYEVSVTLVDEDGGHLNADTLDIQVDNVAPTVDVRGAERVREGETYILTLGTPFDPGDDSVTEYVVDWGDGTVESVSAAGDVGHIYRGAGLRTVSVDLIDEDGAYRDVATLAVEVEDVPLVVTVGAADNRVDEGQPFVLELGPVFDPGLDALVDADAFVIAWGDGAVDALAGTVARASHVYADGDFDYTIRVGVERGGVLTSRAGTFAVAVDDVAPSLTLGGDPTTAVGATYELTLAASDPGNDTITAWSIDWDGDGNFDATAAGNAPSISHMYETSGTFAIVARASNEDGTFAADPLVVTVSETAPEPLQVTALTATASGFQVRFNHAFDPAVIDLYDGSDGGAGSPDLTLIGAGGAVAGSLVFDPDLAGFTFLQTGGPLQAGTYAVQLASSAESFRDAVGALDGDGDGVAGGDFVAQFTTGPLTAVVGIADVMRGPGQALDVPATAAGLPVTLTSAGGITRISFTLDVDPLLATISGVSAGSGVPAGTVVSADLSTPGRVEVTVEAPAPLAAGSLELVRLAGAVPAAATYGSAQVLNITVSSVEGAAAVADDDGLHVIGYPGDADGSGGYEMIDVETLQKAITGADNGFAMWRLIDPVVIADLNGSGVLTSIDATRLLQEISGFDRPEIPPIPAGPGGTERSEGFIGLSPAAPASVQNGDIPSDHGEGSSPDQAKPEEETAGGPGEDAEGAVASGHTGSGNPSGSETGSRLPGPETNADAGEEEGPVLDLSKRITDYRLERWLLAWASQGKTPWQVALADGTADLERAKETLRIRLNRLADQA